MKIDGSGRLTIPVELRRRYGLQMGDEVEFRADRGELVIVPPGVDEGALQQGQRP
ncbi:AbrB/MazE/SpoVT family DNA-binding domain-containing protein [Microbacterium sp. 69-10]|uniref:AbrB/MazE/SpoVT family DNA-binding domain-containing protein n=1 Tax=Microbacterium sp. 69-10 TaxID=1895783 RepID=UPI0025F96758|nr:AbrB/MazE/SpoVT family DNA-binding domain-containing protein [Microbacterium sp. 69-10]